MEYMILDSRGDAVASFDDAVAARATLRAIANDEPDAADSLLLIAYGDDGRPIGDALGVDDLPPAVSVEPNEAFLVWTWTATKAAYRPPHALAEIDRWLASAFPTVFRHDAEPKAPVAA